MEDHKWQRIALVILFFIFIAVLLPGFPGHIFDTSCFQQWASNINEHGLKMAYRSNNDYPPVYQYFLWVFEKIAQRKAIIYDKIAYLRLVTLAFDLLSVWIVWRWTDKKVDKVLLFFVCVLNPGFIYNTVIWGQVDGMLSCLLLLSLWLLWSGRMLPALLVLQLAMNLKFQAVIFLPVFCLLWLHNGLKYKGKPVLVAVCSMLLLQTILFYPFMLTATSRHNLYNAFFGAVGRYPYLSMYAYNLWYWFFPFRGAGLKIDDTLPFFAGLSYRHAGMLLFFVASFIILLPLLRSVLQRLFAAKDTRQDVYPRAKLWLISAAIPLVFFFFNTQMHERYSHPAFVFLIAYAVYAGDKLPFILMSIAVFLNMEMELKWLGLNAYLPFLADPRITSGIYLLLIGYIIFRIYKPFTEWSSGKRFKKAMPFA